MASRVVCVGLDAATFDLLQPWIDQKRLPTLALLMKHGASGILHSTLHPTTPTAWVTFQTGTNPGRHGIFDFSELRIDRPNRPVNATTYRGTPFWKLANDRGLRVGILNMFATYPPIPVNGFIVSGRDTPPGSIHTYPPDLATRLRKSFSYQVDIDPAQRPDLKNVSQDEFLGLLHSCLDARIEATKYLFEKYAPDLFIALFTETDVVQHFFWHAIDPNHPLYTPEQADRYSNAILSVYQKLDELLSWFAGHLDENDYFLVVSDHGAGPWYKQVNLNAWLAQNGYLTILDDTSKSGPLVELKHRLLSFLPLNLRLWVRRRRRRGSLYEILPVDWSRTRAYAIGKFGNIFLNLLGREPRGIVRETEYEALRESICQKLEAWRNPFTGEPLVKRAYRKEEIYTADDLYYAPDIIIEWQDYRYLAVRSPFDQLGLFCDPPSYYNQVPQSGSHTPRGVLVVKGPGIRAGAMNIDAHIIDIAPTILHLCGLPVPSHMEGNVIAELFEQPPQIEQTVYEVTKQSLASRVVYGEDEMKAIEDRLKSLGYM